MRLFWPVQSTYQPEQNYQTLSSYLHLPQHDDCALGTSCRLFNQGIHADAMGVPCYKGSTNSELSDNGTQATRDYQKMGCETTWGIKYSKGNEISICYTEGVANCIIKQLHGVTGQDPKNYLEEIAIGEQALTTFELYTCLQGVANTTKECPIRRPRVPIYCPYPHSPWTGCPNNMLLEWASTSVPQGPVQGKSTTLCIEWSLYRKL